MSELFNFYVVIVVGLLGERSALESVDGTQFIKIFRVAIPLNREMRVKIKGGSSINYEAQIIITF
jgi:hypothetical protein